MQGGDDLMGKEVTVKGWCRTVRDQKAFSFIELNDGSLPKGIQVAEEKKRDTQKRPTNVSKRDLLIHPCFTSEALISYFWPLAGLWTRVPLTAMAAPVVSLCTSL